MRCEATHDLFVMAAIYCDDEDCLLLLCCYLFIHEDIKNFKSEPQRKLVQVADASSSSTTAV